MNKQHWYILGAIVIITLILFVLSSPWRENRSLNQFVKENFREGTSSAQIKKLLEDNGFDITVHENKLSPHLEGKRWMIARKQQRFLFWGEGVLTINLYFDQKLDQFLQYDAHVFLPSVM